MLLSDWLVREQVKRRDFAARVAVSPSLITALCSGAVWPGREVVTRISEATGGEVTANDFVKRPEPATASGEAAD